MRHGLDPEQTMPIAMELPGDNAFPEPGFLSICLFVKSQFMKKSVSPYPKPLSSAEIVSLDDARFSEEDNAKIYAWAITNCAGLSFPNLKCW
jgi:hypothetical protein